MSKEHTPVPWGLNHWSKGGLGVKCISLNKESISYYQGDAIDQSFYNIVADVDPLSHSIEASFEGAHIAQVNDIKSIDGGEMSKANSLFILKAVNNHQKLVEALEWQLNALDYLIS